MRALILLLTIIVSVAGGVFAQSTTLQKRMIRYTEIAQPCNVSFENRKLPAKVHRVSSKRGNIQLLHTERLPDSMRVALDVAKSMWESKIYNKQPIYIDVAFDFLDLDIAMAADVIYFTDSDTSNKLNGCPSSLANQISDELKKSSEDSPDGYIIFNHDIDWVCNFSENPLSGFNLTTMALKGIARCLGFGSSIMEMGEDKFLYYFDIPTYFDNKLYSGTTFLSDLKAESPQMANFVKSENVFLDTPSDTYKIYAPKQYRPYMSLCYFDNENSLMSYSMGEGNQVLAIDDMTLDVLKSIGWDLPTTGFKIISSDISDDGIGSSYSSHTFSLDKGSSNVSNYQWKFYLLNKSKEFELVSTGNSSDFTIDAVEFPEDYDIDYNGDIQGRVECSYTVGDIEYNAVPFSLSLELAPVIFSIDNLNVVKQEGKHSFYVTFTVRYAGSDYIDVEVEEEYDPAVRSYWIQEPFVAHVKTGYISSLYYSWITVNVTNEYGSVNRTMTFYPDIITSTEEIGNEAREVVALQLFNLSGTMMFDGHPSDLSAEGFPKGIYLKKEIFDNGNSNTSKYVIL